jgi:predicted MFS family arabinose efflux permease
VLMVIWGVSGTISNLYTGNLADSIGDRKLIPSMLILLTLVVATFSWTGAALWTTIPALIIYGAVAWGLLAPQQRRLVHIAPQTAPVVLGLNTSFTYLGVTVAGIIGALGIPVFGAHRLGYLGAAIVAVALAVAQMATWRISVASAAQARQADELVTA